MQKSRFFKRNSILCQAKQFIFNLSTEILIIFIFSQSDFAQLRTNFKKLPTDFALDERIENTDGIKIRKKLKKLLSNPPVKLFLASVKEAEGGEPNLMVGGCRAKNLKQHPAETLPKSCFFPININGKIKHSTRSGNYQLTLENWKQLASFLGLKDFSEENQALAALELIRRGGGAANAYTEKGLAIKNRIQTGFLALLAGNLKSAFRLASYDWASSKSSPLPVPPGYKKIDYWQLSEKIKNRRAANDKKIIK
ncbi:MAG TPA: hypothetical protein VGB00_03185, partial [Pyrinomonadaceae bacterium]